MTHSSLRIGCVALVVLAAGSGCSNSEKSSATQRKINVLAVLKYGAPCDLLPNSDNTFILCIKHEKEKIPIQPIRFFLYDIERDSVVYERELDYGTVDWLNASQLSIKQIPGNITGDETPASFTEIYDVTTGKTFSR